MLDADVKFHRFRPNKHFVLLRWGVNTLFSYNLWGSSAQLLASNHKTEIRSVFPAGEDKRAVSVLPFLLKEPRTLRLTLPQSLQLPLLLSDHLRNSTKIFSSILQPPYFHFIVRDIKRSNYLISELWKHVCYEKTSKSSFNCCRFSRSWRGAYLFGTFFPS